MITNGVSDYVNLLVRMAHIICNHPIFRGMCMLWSSSLCTFLRLLFTSSLVQYSPQNYITQYNRSTLV